MINDILTAVAERLSGVTAIKYIDEDWGQLDYYSEHPPVKFPCVLLDIQQMSWRNQGRLAQDGTVTINIRVSDMKLSNTNAKASSSQKEKAAAIWEILEAIHKLLHGWRPGELPAFSDLTRLSSRRLKRDDGIREFEVIYSTIYTDSATVIEPQKRTAKLSLRV
jgi:hypothetical protein